MPITQITAYLTVIKSYIKTGKKAKEYKFRSNNYIYEVLKKLQATNFIKDLTRPTPSETTFDLEDLEEIKMYKHPRLVFKASTAKKIHQSQIQNDQYLTLLISTNSGLYLLEQALANNKSGLVIGKIRSKRKRCEK